MTTPQERVFNSTDLRHEIWKYVIKDKLEIHNILKKILGGEKIKNWKKYCKCNTCTAWRKPKNI